MRAKLILIVAASSLTACSSSGSTPPAGPGPLVDAAAGVPDLRPVGGEAGPDRNDGNDALDGTTSAPDVPAVPDVAAPPVDGGTAGWPAIGDYGSRGPLAITRESNTGPSSAYDIFRPATLGADRRQHPIISWANGTLYDIPQYQTLLEHWASHGFVVIAGQTNTTAGGGTHKAGIDWLVAESSRAGSAYLGVLDTARIGAAGHSQGGGATIAAGSNKPGPTGIVATLPLMPLLRFESDAGIVMRQTAPMLNINASMDDRDPSGAVANQIFSGATRELVQASFVGIHEDAMNPAMFRPTLAWFRLHLMADQSARALFYPTDSCGLCKDPAWKQVRHKSAPP